MLVTYFAWRRGFVILTNARDHTLRHWYHSCEFKYARAPTVNEKLMARTPSVLAIVHGPRSDAVGRLGDNLVSACDRGSENASVMANSKEIVELEIVDQNTLSACTPDALTPDSIHPNPAPFRERNQKVSIHQLVNGFDLTVCRNISDM